MEWGAEDGMRWTRTRDCCGDPFCRAVHLNMPLCIVLNESDVRCAVRCGAVMCVCVRTHTYQQPTSVCVSTYSRRRCRRRRCVGLVATLSLFFNLDTRDDDDVGHRRRDDVDDDSCCCVRRYRRRCTHSNSRLAARDVHINYTAAEPNVLCALQYNRRADECHRRS